jgi:hypothetical protein
LVRQNAAGRFVARSSNKEQLAYYSGLHSAAMSAGFDSMVSIVLGGKNV